MHALVLSGCGAKGAYQANELVSQFREGLKPDIIYGNGIGAFNAVGFAYQKEKLEAVWRNIQSRSSIFHFNWKFWNTNGIYNTRPLRHLLDKLIQNRTPFCEVAVCDVDLISKKITYSYLSKMDRPHFLDAARASTSMPLIMSPVGTHVDGGIRQIAPLKQAILDGADEITVLLCDPFQLPPYPDHWHLPKGLLSFVHIGARALDIFGNEIFINDIKNCYSYNQISQKKYIKLRVFGPRQEDLFIQPLEFDSVKINCVFEDQIRMIEYFPQSFEKYDHARVAS